MLEGMMWRRASKVPACTLDTTQLLMTYDPTPGTMVEARDSS